MSEKTRIARDAALACAFIIVQRIRHAFRDEELEPVFEEIREAVEDAVQAALAEHENAPAAVLAPPTGVQV